MDTKLKISPHEIIFKTQKNIETSIPGFHSILFRSDFSPTNEPPCKITFRLFSIYDKLKCPLILNRIFLTISRNYFPFHAIDKKTLFVFSPSCIQSFQRLLFYGSNFPSVQPIVRRSILWQP